MEHIKKTYESQTDLVFPYQGEREINGLDVEEIAEDTLRMVSKSLQNNGRLEIVEKNLLEKCYNELRIIIPHLDKNDRQYFVTLRQLSKQTLEIAQVINSRTDWHKVSKQGILMSKILMLFLILAIFIFWTKNIIAPYNVFMIGIECALFVMASLMIVRMSTYKLKVAYDTSKLSTKNEQLKLLLTNITYDIDRFEEGASYYYNGVRVYKYSTMILSALSTILLGLSFRGLPFFSDNFQQYYPILAKNIAFIIGAITTVYTALITYWNIEKYWLQNKSVVNKLRDLRDEIENEESTGEWSNFIIQAKFKKYQDIKGEFYKYWDGALSAPNA